MGLGVAPVVGGHDECRPVEEPQVLESLGEAPDPPIDVLHRLQIGLAHPTLVVAGRIDVR